MQKSVIYYYPDGNNPSKMKVFQDRSSQVRGFRFNKEKLRDISKEEYSSNYSIYFLIDDDNKKIYVGQSKQGVKRISNHVREKEFWRYCVMFVSDNNAFDSNAIDYMEYYFINNISKDSKYSIMNSDLRVNSPNLNYFDQVTYNSYISQIIFLLNAEGIDLSEEDNLDSSEVKQVDESKSYLYEGEMYGYVSTLEYKSGRFILKKGSEVLKPNESIKNWKGGERMYSSYMKAFNKYFQEGFLNKENDVLYILNEDLEFNSPSAAANFVTGRNKNGWHYFKGVDKHRN